MYYSVSVMLERCLHKLATRDKSRYLQVSFFFSELANVK